MDADLLLTWLSEKGSGTWAEFKAAHSWLGRDDAPGASAWTVARDLSSLGHLEISWEGEGQWAIAPPVLTLLPGCGRALLTGGRTRALYTPPSAFDDGSGTGRFVDAANELDLWPEPWSQRGGCTTATVAVESEVDAQNLAGMLGIPFTYDVAEQLARLLPALSDFERLWVPGELLRGFDAELFDPDTCLWSNVTDLDAPGLYRCRTHARRIFALRTAMGSWSRVPPEPAVYEVLRWEGLQVLEYDEARRELSVPGTASLPLLAARAATLCSGRIPRRTPQSRGWSRVTYVNVPRSVAERISRSLSQELINV